MVAIRAYCNEGVQTEISNERHVWHIDEPVSFGGKDSAPSPVDMFLGSLAGCIIAVGNVIADEMSLKLTPMEVQIEGQIDSRRFFGLDDAERAGFQKILIRIIFPPMWSPTQCEDWWRRVEIRCPVLDNLLNPTKVDVVFE